MKHFEGTFQGFEKCSLYFQSWHPDTSSQAIVVLVHGLGGHSGGFHNVVDDLVPQGYEVYALDLRGHGRSAGQRGHIDAWAEFREDLRAFLAYIHTQRASCPSHCPIILWGHSLGGTIVLDYALRSPEQIQGLIVTAPALGKVGVSSSKLLLGRWLSKLMPHFSLKVGFSKQWTSRDPVALAAYLQDPLRHEYGSARLATEFFTTVDWINDHAADLKVPLLLMHGTADHITSPEGSRAFFQHVLYPDKEHREYPGHYHDLFIDLDYHRMFSDVEVWLDRHLADAERCQPFTACAIAASPKNETQGLPTTLPALLDTACEQTPNAQAFNQWTESGWQALSNRELQQQVEKTALGLLGLGLSAGDRVAFLMHSDLNFVIADLGCQLAHLVDVPIDITQTLENILFVVQHSQARVLVLSNLDLLEQIAPYLADMPALQQILVAQVPADWPQLRGQWLAAQDTVTQPSHAPKSVGLNLCPEPFHATAQISWPACLQVLSLQELPAQVGDQPPPLYSPDGHSRKGSRGTASTQHLQTLRASLNPADLATIIYIPAADGKMHGVMLSHANLTGNVLATFAELTDLGRGDAEVVLSFLPLTHVFARHLLYGHITYGHSIYFSDPNRLLRHLQQVKPTILAAVPLLLEKIYSQILERGQKLKSGWQRLIFQWALGLAQHYQVGHPPLSTASISGGIYALLLNAADRLVFWRWRSLFGGRLKYLLSGGAALRAELVNAFAAAGIPILQGYGLTQAGGVVSFNRPSHNRAGTVGTPIPGMELALATDGEILLRSPYLSAGYYNNLAATQAEIDAQGWWRTGDLGRLTPTGQLQITGLKKALFKLSTGKYIAPDPLETRLQASPLVEWVMVVGADRKFCAALIFPNLAELSRRARDIGLELAPPALLQHPCIVGWYQALVDAANCHLPYWALLRRFRLLAAEFSVANGLLTPQGQVVRTQVSQTFAAEIAAVYGEVDSKAQSKSQTKPQGKSQDKSSLKLPFFLSTHPAAVVPVLDEITCPIPPAPACPVTAQSLNPQFTS
jgi:long-chain acyl-CoA synthetase